MRITKKQLIKYFKSYVSKNSSITRNKCPDIESIFTSFCDQTTESLKLKLLDHIANCSFCTKEFIFILRLQTKQDLFLNNHDFQKTVYKAFKINVQKKIFGLLKLFTPQKNNCYSIKHTLLALIGTFFILSASILIISNKNEYSILQRSIGNWSSIISPIGNIYCSGQIDFRWDKLDRANFYIFELFDDSLELIWRSPSGHDTTYRLPTNIFHSLRLNTTYLWSVTAVIENNIRIHSPLTEFMLVEKQY